MLACQRATALRAPGAAAPVIQLRSGTAFCGFVRLLESKKPTMLEVGPTNIERQIPNLGVTGSNHKFAAAHVDHEVGQNSMILRTSPAAVA